MISLTESISTFAEKRRVMIDNLSDQEKSILLAKAMGWKPLRLGFQMYDYELYDSANMALAWRVLNWGFVLDARSMTTVFTDWYKRHAIRIARNLTGQRIWLDKILELAIEAGIVEVEND